MIRIHKQNEPRSLITHRASGGTYDTYADKEDLRASLHAEQKGICCYCMQRIDCAPLKMKIEHCNCQSRYPAEQLIYSNLLGACTGNEGQPASEHHCDTKKANQNLSKNPALAPDIDLFIEYGTDGKVSSNDPLLRDQLESVLNLNITTLVNNRKAVLDGFRSGGDPKMWTKRQFDKLVIAWSDSTATGSHRPFCGVALFWLAKRAKGPFRK